MASSPRPATGRRRPPAALLESFLSPERLAPYRSATRDVDAAVALYEWNSRVGAAFLEDLGHLEVVLRNALHVQLAIWHTRSGLPGSWYSNPVLQSDPHRADDIHTARVRLQRCGKPETDGRVVAEFSFGFWRFLLGPRYQTTLWAQALRHSFPELRPQRRSTVYDAIERLGRLRNRIAHHEPIHHLPLIALQQEIRTLAGHLHPAVQAWITSVGRVPGLLHQRPGTPQRT